MDASEGGDDGHVFIPAFPAHTKRQRAEPADVKPFVFSHAERQPGVGELCDLYHAADLFSVPVSDRRGDDRLPGLPCTDDAVLRDGGDNGAGACVLRLQQHTVDLQAVAVAGREQEVGPAVGR